MENKIQIPFVALGEEAIYKEQVIGEYKGNPYIEALPNELAKEEVIDRLICYPSFDVNERLMAEHYRYHIVQRLFQYFQPLNIHIDLENRISKMIRQGYVARNPFSRGYIRGLHIGYDAINNRNIDIINKGDFNATSNSLIVTGDSGMGKSISINKILSLYPQVLIHSNYKGTPFSQYQVTWLKLDCRYNGSVKGLGIDFLIEIDNVLGTNYYKKVNSPVNIMLPAICQIARRSGLGILVIDEIQNLFLARNAEIEEMLNFFDTFINAIGVPVILIGTNKIITVLQNQMIEVIDSQEYISLDRIKSEKEPSWLIFTDMLFEYQWVKEPSKQNEKLRHVLYEESQGILDIAIKIFVMAQVKAIATGREEITPNLIRHIGKENLKLVKPVLNKDRMIL